jgi:hypothetical protein
VTRGRLKNNVGCYNSNEDTTLVGCDTQFSEVIIYGIIGCPIQRLEEEVSAVAC